MPLTPVSTAGILGLLGALLACADPAQPAPDRQARNLTCAEISRLVEQKQLDDAIPPLATLVLAGDDHCFAQLIQYGQHSEDETLQLRLLLAAHRHLLERLPNLSSQERARAERFLSGGLFVENPPPFSRDVEERQLAEWEAELQRLQQARGPGAGS
jgi:hypothetical protein